MNATPEQAAAHVTVNALPHGPQPPHQARIYDYWLGGKDNLAADREAGEKVLTLVPDVRAAARANRTWMGRVVRSLVAEGVNQFLDLGSGLPTVGNVHEVAQEVDPAARVVYIDYDPVVLAHARALLVCDERTAALPGDIRRPDQVLAVAEHLLDLSRPVAVIAAAVFHFISPADDPAGIVSELAAGVAPGSWLALSHATRPDDGHAASADYTAAETAYRDLTGRAFHLRRPGEVEHLFTAGFPLIGGLYRPDPALPLIAGVGRSPGAR